MLILIVDDNDLTRILLKDILEAHGHTVITAVDGKEALELASRDKPALITMDLQLPVLSGLEATRALKANPATASIPVIAITAAAMKGEEEEARQAGCDDYISKPFDIDAMFGKLKSYLPVDKSEESGPTGSGGST